MSGYDQERHLPDNNGVPRESGLYVWLNEQVTRTYGPGLVQESQQHGDKRYLWLLEQLQERGDSGLITEYHTRHKAIEYERRQRDRQREIDASERN